MEEKKKNFSKYIIPFFIIAVVASWGYYFYHINQKISFPEELTSKEINEYEGQDLSSINDFRENSIKGPQYIDRESYRLKIKGLSSGEKDYTYDEVIKNHKTYKKVITLNCVEGWSVKIFWEGVLIKDLVDEKEIPAQANTIIFRSHDGYSTSFPIDYIFSNNIIMAYKMNGLELPPELGFPFQLVAESKYGYKWAKWVTEIEFSSDSNYKGYWESRGYSNDADLNKGFFK